VAVCRFDFCIDIVKRTLKSGDGKRVDIYSQEDEAQEEQEEKIVKRM
jgi:hypothetical protein